MREKKGVTVLAIVYLTIAVFVGVILFFLFPTLIELGENIGILTLNYEKERPVIEDVEILRYDFVMGSVDFYDGTTWNKLDERGASIGERVFSEVRVRANIEDYYYQLNGAARSRQELETSVRIDSDGEVSNDGALIVEISDFDRVAKGGTIKEREDYGRNIIEFSLTLEQVLRDDDVEHFRLNKDSGLFRKDDQGKYVRLSSFDTDEAKSEIVSDSAISDVINYVELWRDGILKGGSDARYIVLRENSGDEAKVCPEILDNLYLLINLEETVSEDSDCA